MIYLASPYSHPDPAVREQRFKTVCAVTARFLRDGHLIWSPIIGSHPLVEHGLPTGFDFWERLDRALIDLCSEVWVLTLDGWQASSGVRAEVKYAREQGKPVRYVKPDEWIEPKK